VPAEGESQLRWHRRADYPPSGRIPEHLQQRAIRATLVPVPNQDALAIRAERDLVDGPVPLLPVLGNELSGGRLEDSERILSPFLRWLQIVTARKEAPAVGTDGDGGKRIARLDWLADRLAGPAIPAADLFARRQERLAVRAEHDAADRFRRPGIADRLPR